MKIQKPQKMTPPKGGEKPNLFELLEKKLAEIPVKKRETQSNTIYIGFHLPVDLGNQVLEAIKSSLANSPIKAIVQKTKGTLAKRDWILLFILHNLATREEELVLRILRDIYKISL